MPVQNYGTLKGRIEYLNISSDALADNMLGDPAERTVAVYLPDTTERVPLLVDLVGFTGSGLAHVGWKAFAETVPQRVERLIHEGRMGPVAVAFPDCFTSLGGNQYVNSASLGRWEDFLTGDMITRLEADLPILPGQPHRGVFGKSSGGYGAIVHGMRHADTWAAIACHSGDMDFDLCYRGDMASLLMTLSKYPHGIEGFMKKLQTSRKVGGGEMHDLMMLAMAASYDPDPDAPYGIRLPVTMDTCELIPERWANWLAFDPVRMIEEESARENLGRLSRIYIDCGSRDQYNLVFGARQLVKRLNDHNIAHEYEEFDDNHSSIDYRMDESLPRLFEAVTG